MSYYLCTNVTEEEMNFTKGKMYFAEVNNDVTCLYDDDGQNRYTATRADFLDYMKNMGVHLTLATEGADGDYVKIMISAGELKENKLYRVFLKNIDFDTDEPLLDVFEGCTVTLESISLSKENLVCALRDGFDVYDFCGALNMHSLLDIRVSSFAAFYNQNHAVEEMEMIQFPAYLPTETEISKIIADMGELLDEYDYNWTEDALRKIVKTFFEKKGRLLSAFMAHPNYNGNYQIVFSDESYRLDTNQNAGMDFVSWINSVFNSCDLLKQKTIMNHTWDELEMVKAYHKATMPVVKPILVGDELYLANYDLMEKKRREIDKVEYLMQLFRGQRHTEESLHEQSVFNEILIIIRNYQSDRMDAATATKINDLLPSVRARKDQKTTKVVGKIMAYFGIDKLEKYHKYFAKYCDDINIIKIKRHTILSLNPLDYLTMSFGNSWSSCHTIDKNNKRNLPGEGYHGMYSSGTVSYMLDEVSFVLYTVDSNYDGNTFWEQNKINRCMFHMGNERLVQGRCYPQAEDSNSELYKQFRALVHRTIAEIWNIPNLWVLKKSGFRNDISHMGTNYADYFNYSLCNITTYKFAKNKKEIITIGATPLCISCGRPHHDKENIGCCNRSYTEEYYCSDCGGVFDEEDLHYIDGEYYCDDCCFWCEYHERYEVGNEYCYVEGYGDICESAYDHGGFFYCEDCGRYYHRDDGIDVTDYERVCVNCFENDYVYVDSENEYHHRDDVIICDYCDHTVLRNSVTHVEDHGDICEDCLDEYFHEDDDGNYIHNEAEAV